MASLSTALEDGSLDSVSQLLLELHIVHTNQTTSFARVLRQLGQKGFRLFHSVPNPHSQHASWGAPELADVFGCWEVSYIRRAHLPLPNETLVPQLSAPDF